MISINVGHLLDCIRYIFGEFQSVTAMIHNSRNTIEVRDEKGKKIRDAPLTSHDQMTVTGVLTSDAYASVHLRGGLYKGTNLLWEIEGTKGELQVKGTSGILQFSSPTLYGSFDGEDMREIGLDDEQGNHVNVGRAYDEFAKEGGKYPTWEDDVVRHRLIDAIYKSVQTGRKQTYQMKY